MADACPESDFAAGIPVGVRWTRAMNWQIMQTELAGPRSGCAMVRDSGFQSATNAT